jgi:hypothetical protein
MHTSRSACNALSRRPRRRVFSALAVCVARLPLAFLRWLWRADNAARWTAAVSAIVASYIVLEKLGLAVRTRSTLTEAFAVTLLFYALAATVFRDF